MTTTAPQSLWQAPKVARRIQVALVVGALLASVAVSAMLVAVPGTTSPSSSDVDQAARPTLSGSRVAIRGGDPFVAFELADRLAAHGAQLGAVAPGGSGSDGEEAVTTLILYYERAQLDAARQIRVMLGEGTLRRRQVFQPNEDVTVVVGKDLSHL
jgi:hypothetical protein